MATKVLILKDLEQLPNLYKTTKTHSQLKTAFYERKGDGTMVALSILHRTCSD